ncbi:19229_t:CDS:2, partial [Dentiscutata erythropus]
MSVKTIESYFNNTQNSSKSMLEDDTRICKVCDKDKGVVGKWGSLTLLMPITRHFEQKHPNTFKVFGKFAAKLPFSLLEENCFAKFVSTLDPHYKIPCHQSMSENIKKLF